jgi:hypothetical protein
MLTETGEAYHGFAMTSSVTYTQPARLDFDSVMARQNASGVAGVVCTSCQNLQQHTATYTQQHTHTHVCFHVEGSLIPVCVNKQSYKTTLTVPLPCCCAHLSPCLGLMIPPRVNIHQHARMSSLHPCANSYSLHTMHKSASSPVLKLLAHDGLPGCIVVVGPC